MKYLLDSNIVIAAATGFNPRLRARLESCDEGDLVTSSVVYAEVLHGSVKGREPALAVLDRVLVDVPVLAFDRDAALACARLPFERDRFDHLIAAHALSRDLTVVTDNTKHFAKISGLRVENWMS